MWLLAWLLALAPGPAAEELPIVGLASVAFRVSDLNEARRFYTGVLGFEQAFLLKAEGGAPERVFLKINDEQFIELWPGLPPEQEVRLAQVAVQASDVRRLRRLLEARGLAPRPLEKRADGNLGFRLPDPDGTLLEFVEYSPGSLQAKARGKFLGPQRVAERLWHAGVTVSDLARAMAFYRDRLGLVEIWRGGPSETELRWVNMRLPGPRGDYLEYMLHSGRPGRQQLGSMQHICLQTPDVEAAYRRLLARGLPDSERFRPRVGRNGRRLANLFDPDGSRTELMEPDPARGRATVSDHGEHATEFPSGGRGGGPGRLRADAAQVRGQ